MSWCPVSSSDAAQGTIVVATRDRADVLAGTLERLTTLPDRWDVIVVDDASTDATAEVVRRRFPQVRLVRLPSSEGAGARNVGVATADTEVVAFADDDSWWAPGALDRAAAHLAAHPDLGLVAARCLVEPAGQVDPVSVAQAASPLASCPPGPSVLGFLACAAVVRRSSFLAVGGFHPVIGFLGEEAVLAVDLRAAGWRLAYVDDVVAHHHPGLVSGDRQGRGALQLRNEVLATWLRRPLLVAVEATSRLAVRAVHQPEARQALAGVLGRLPAALADRRPVAAALEAELSVLEQV